MELTQKDMEKLLLERKELYKNNNVGRSWVSLTNKIGTRYLQAFRCDGGWWRVRYGKIVLTHFEGSYMWEKSLKDVFTMSATGVEIPKYVRVKKDVLELAQKLGLMEI